MATSRWGSDWGRVGLDGKPRPLHVSESLATIDFAARSTPVTATSETHSAGGTVRRLARCAYFTIEERRVADTTGTAGGADGRCSIVVCLAGRGRLTTAGGTVALEPMCTRLVPAAAGRWTAGADADGMHLLVAQPVLG